MKAVIVTDYGAPQVLQVQDIITVPAKASNRILYDFILGKVRL